MSAHTVSANPDAATAPPTSSNTAEVIIAKARQELVVQADQLCESESLIRLGSEIADGISGARAYWSDPYLWVVIVVERVEQMTEIRRRFAARGFRLVRVNEYPDSHYQTHCLGVEGMRGEVMICFQFASAIQPGVGASCAYVKVGVKETPVYELRCGDSPKASS